MRAWESELGEIRKVAGAMRTADRRQTGWRGDCTRVHPAQVLSPAATFPRPPSCNRQPVEVRREIMNIIIPTVTS